MMSRQDSQCVEIDEKEHSVHEKATSLYLARPNSLPLPSIHTTTPPENLMAITTAYSYPDGTTRNIKQRKLSLSLRMLHILLREKETTRSKISRYEELSEECAGFDAEMLKGCFASFRECDIHKAIVLSLIVT